MRIKRVELVGFKSFCDKASLDFRQRISCVVGPNGCGKSNIVDALLWAMGEQRARHLRGKSMEDVIFNGSDSRGPSGMAEASITFENDGRIAPEYLDYSEIMVSRRLHRDGTSEYLINRVPVRLRDVTNLFLGTGVGTRAYSIIEQGRIGLIVSARPEDRRHFIEEAAGITKYQRRKQAAERKIEATAQNLLRVSDIVEELGKRLGSLRRQAKKAERYREYRAEMRDIELWFSSHRLLEIIAEEKLHRGELELLEQQREQNVARLAEREAAIELERLACGEEERRLTAVQEELFGLDNRVKLNENNIRFQSHEAEELDQRAGEDRREVAELERQIAEADERILATRASVGLLEEQRDQLHAELARCDARLGALRAELAEMHRASESERAEVARAERTGARVEATLRALGQRRRDVSERVERCREEMGRVVERAAVLQASAGDLDGQLDALRLDVEQLVQRRDEARAQLDGLADDARRGETEIEVLRTELHRRRSRLTSLREISQRFEGFGRGTRAVMQKINGEAREKGVLGLVADVLEAPAAYETALEAVLGQRLGTIIVENEEVGLEAIEYLKQNAEGRSSFINRWCRRSSLLDRAPVGAVWSFSPDGDRPDGEAERGATAAPLMLRAPGCGGVSLEGRPGVHGSMLGLIGCDRELRPVAESLLGDVVVVDKLDNALLLWDEVEDRTLVTLDGEILGPDGTFTGGSNEAEQSGVLRQKREIKELTEIIADLEEQYRCKLDAHLAVKARMATLEQLLEETAREGHQGDKDILSREKDLSRISSEIDALLVRREELEREEAQLRVQVAEMETQEEEHRLEAETALREACLAEDILFLLQREESRLSRLAEEAAAAVGDSRVELAEGEARWRAALEELARLEERRRERSDRIERLEGGAVEGLARAAELRAKVEALEEELRDLVTRRAACQDRLSAGRGAYEARLAALGEVEIELKQLRALVHETNEEVTGRQLKVSELALSRRHLEEQVWERYRVELPRVIGDYHLRAPVGEQALERLTQLRQLIERMGEINLTAIDEYEELSGRYEFLSRNKADLESAIVQLQRAIQKINRTSRKRFQETFEQVNAKFQEVFPRLFRGGRARLVLTDEQNLLESGVDIVAQPPGKKLQSIELLSGGEKALTAVSLIFSMFLVKPTPFCLLDEVDAPLDEANVIRFNEMVREMASSSQFIVITHNRRTMEIADRLYGVTMEEPGISKLVSVNLSGEEEPVEPEQLADAASAA